MRIWLLIGFQDLFASTEMILAVAANTADQANH